jgi:exosome complex RNA-binding protein Rrp42 (RNase PH superfamily)
VITADLQQEEQRFLHLSFVPMATSCAMYGGCLITDPDAEEVAVASSIVTSVVDEGGRLIGIPRHILHKAYKFGFAAYSVLSVGRIGDRPDRSPL